MTQGDALLHSLTAAAPSTGSTHVLLTSHKEQRLDVSVDPSAATYPCAKLFNGILKTERHASVEILE